MNRPNRAFAAWIGYLIDAYRILTYKFGNGHSLVKYQQIKALGKRTNAKLFIESGTFKGVTAARCARLLERVFTVQLDAQLFEEARAYLRAFRNVEIIHGDAAKEVPTVVCSGARHKRVGIPRWPLLRLGYGSRRFTRAGN